MKSVSEIEKELENKLVGIHVNKLLENGIAEIYIPIKNISSLELIGHDGERAPIGWILNCLSVKEKFEALTYMLRGI